MVIAELARDGHNFTQFVWRMGISIGRSSVKEPITLNVLHRHTVSRERERRPAQILQVVAIVRLRLWQRLWRHDARRRLAA